MKMYSNTISIVHSNFRRKESLYLFIQALFLSWTDTSFRDLVFFISPAKNISSTSSWSSLRLIWNCKRNLKFQLWFCPLCGPQQPGALGSGPSCALSAGRSSAGSSGEQDPEWGWPGQGAQARPWLPPLASNSKLSLQTPSGDSPPLRAPGCWGPHSGWNHNWNFKFRSQFQINRNELRDEVLEIFFAIEIRAGFNKCYPAQNKFKYSGFPLFFIPSNSLTFPWFPKIFPWFFLSFHQDILVKKKNILILFKCGLNDISLCKYCNFLTAPEI